MLEYPGRKSRLEHVARRGALDIIRNGERKTAQIAMVSQDAAPALAGAGLIVVAAPAFAHRAFADLVAPHLRGDETILVFTAALGGLEFNAAARRLGRTHRGPIVEAENLPYTCRIAGPSEVIIHLDVPKFRAATYPARLTAEAEAQLQPLIPGITFGRDLLDPLLGNMNGVVHPPVVLLNVPVMERARGEPWWIWEVGVTKSIARVIDDLDAERLAVGRAVGLTIEPVADMMWRSGYGPRGTIYETINGCAALRNVRGPLDLSHRWYTEDIPYTLALWADLGRHCGVKTPLMESLCGLASSLLARDVWNTGRSLADVGLAGLDASSIVAALYHGLESA
ncbi:MAG: hypothetical protein FJX56_10685 [Alphaproteobacteria bacterium]|nr:hypothetical protein [Alphaproteobacteria bacterium]